VTLLRRAAHSRRLALVIVVLGVFAYPLAVLAQGVPHFHTRADCLGPAKSDGDVDLVFGSFGSYAAADELLGQIKQLGFVTASAVSDGCGRVDVAVVYTSLAAARSAVPEANNVHLHPKVSVIAR
jgi:hypothetical protein